jgi:hypothetical protein
MIEVTLDEFKEVLKGLILSGKNRRIALIEDTEDRESMVGTVYTVTEGKFTEKETDLALNDVYHWVIKKGLPTYRLIDEKSPYHFVYPKDTEEIIMFVDYAKRLAGLAGATPYRPEITEILNEMTHMFRISEESGYSLAEMYCDDIELTQHDYTLNESE